MYIQRKIRENKYKDTFSSQGSKKSSVQSLIAGFEPGEEDIK